MSFLHVETSEHSKDQFVLVDPVLLTNSVTPIGSPVWIELTKIPSILDNHDFGFWNAFDIDQVVFAAMRNGHDAVLKSGTSTIHHERGAADEAFLKPPLFHAVQCFQTDGHACQSGDRREVEACLEHVGVDDLNSVTAQESPKTEHVADIGGTAYLQGQDFCRRALEVRTECSDERWRSNDI